MGQYPTPSVSWMNERGNKTHIHFLWEFGIGDVACGLHIPKGTMADYSPNRMITCRKCIFQIYGVHYNESGIFGDKRYFSGKIDGVNVIGKFEIINILRAKIRRRGDLSALAGEIGIHRGVLYLIINDERPIHNKVLEYLGYERVVGFVDRANYAEKQEKLQEIRLPRAQ